MSPPLPSNEFERLIELEELGLDYTSLHEHLADLTKLASRIAGVDVSFVNLLDNYTQWTVAFHGHELQSMPREDSICQYAILENNSLEIKDLRRDERFSQKSYVTGDPNFRYYYGIPLETSSGVNLGALCVLGLAPKKLSVDRMELLQMVAGQVVRRLKELSQFQALRGEIEELKQANRKVSHDIRDPISGMIGLARIIHDSANGDQGEDVVDLAKMIEESCESVLELADGIMNSGDSSKQPGENEFSCETLAQKLNQLYLPQAKSKGINLLFRPDEGRGVFFAKNRLLQIVGNLISNSIKFTPSGGEVSVAMSVVEAGRADSSQVEIVVEDSGAGMSAEKVQQILGGGTASELGTSGEKGYGFGLSLVHHLVQKARGSMELSSVVGSGTRFTVKLPACELRNASSAML